MLTVGLRVFMIVLFRNDSDYSLSDCVRATKMIELFFALMLCILREIIKNGCDNVFIETGNVLKMTAKSYTLTLETKSYRI